jgi:hypothetical protein
MLKELKFTRYSALFARLEVSEQAGKVQQKWAISLVEGK